MIFISFSSNDVATAKQLYRRLLDAGYDCDDLFLDRQTIKHGEYWEETLFKNLNNCRALLILCSPHWLASKWCFTELAIAKCQRSTTILPLVIHDLEPEGWQSSGLGSLQRRNFTLSLYAELSEDFDNLCLRLNELGLGPSDNLKPPVSKHPDRANFRVLEFTEWAALPSLQQELRLADEQRKFVSDLQAELESGEQRHLHVAGNAGCGKTRLVLESFRSDQLQRQVVYYTDPADLMQDKFLHYVTTTNETRSYIIVVDDCHSVEYRAIWNRLADVNVAIRLVTISHDDNIGATAVVYRVPQLPQSQIEEILKSYEPGAEIDVSGYAEFCRNSPRFAHLVGESLKAHPGSVALGPDEDWIVPRVICGRTDSESAAGQQLLTVARFVALFDRFGVEAPHQTEVTEVATMIKEFHPTIGLGEVLTAIHQLRSKRILQGKRTVVMVPKALQGILWRQWWNIYGGQFRVASVERLSGPMRNYFLLELEGTLETVNRAEVSESLLTHDSWFYEWESYRPFWGSRLLSILADSAPVIAFQCVERFVGHPTIEKLRERIASTADNQWGVVQVVKDATMRRTTAVRAARLLRQFALAEASENGDATQRFCSYFTLGQGQRSPSELSPTERFVLLDEMLSSQSREERQLALKACGTALNIHMPHSGIGRLPSLGEPLQLWRAQSDAELESCFIALWDKICHFVEVVSDEDDANEATAVLGKALFALAQESAAEHCISTLKILCSERQLNVEPVVKTIVGLWRRSENISEHTRVQLKDLYDSIVASSFEARLRRYIGMSFFDDQVSVAFPVPPIDDIDAETEKLADACIENPDILVPHLDWVITSAKRAWYFGKEVGVRDTQSIWLARITDRLRQVGSSNTAFLGGYLHGLRQRSQPEYERFISSLSADDELKLLMPDLLFRSGGLTEKVATLISQQLDDGSMKPDALGGLFFDRNLKELPDAVFLNWMQHLVNANTANSLRLCINFLHRRLCLESPDRKSVVPVDFLMEVVSHDVFWNELLIVQSADECVDHEWNSLAELLIVQDADLAVTIAARYFSVLAQHRRLPHRASSGYVDKAIYRILDERPEATWNSFFAALDDEQHEHDEGLLYWVSGRQHSIHRDNWGLWSQMPPDRLWTWIDGDLPQRVRQVANFLPPLVTGAGVTPTTIAFLKRYSSFHDACMILVSSVQPGIVESKFRDAYANRLAEALDAQANESDPVIAIWLDRHIECLTAAIEREDASEKWERERNEER